ncbi:MAG: IclR family transcriptional regulator [Paracoccaceae bacterium]
MTLPEAEAKSRKSRPKAQRGVQTVETAGAILRAFTEAARPMKLRELSDKVGIVPAQLHPYLVSLRAIGMVEQTDAALYALGPFALSLGLARLRDQDAYAEAIRRIGDLAEETQLMVAISVWGAHGATIVYVRNGPQLIHSYVRPGGVFELGVTATGRLFAAFLPAARTEERIRAGFAREGGPQSASYGIDEDWFRERLTWIRANGYETTCGIPIPGVNAVTAPVFDHTGGLQLSVTVIGPGPAVDTKPDGALVPALLRFTETLSADLGYWRETAP